MTNESYESETPAETIERLTELNNQLAQMLKRGSDRLQSSARELMAQGWDRGVIATMQADGHNQIAIAEVLTNNNPYRQPIETIGDPL